MRGCRSVVEVQAVDVEVALVVHHGDWLGLGLRGRGCLVALDLHLGLRRGRQVIVLRRGSRLGLGGRLGFGRGCGRLGSGLLRGFGGLGRRGSRLLDLLGERGLVARDVVGVLAGRQGLATDDEVDLLVLFGN